MRALVAAPDRPTKLELRNVPDPAPQRFEALVRVQAISLNRGEVRALQSAADGWRPGWDLAGEVLAPASDGSGPPAGARVVGLVRSGAWAERAAVPTAQLARLPDAVTVDDAAALPVAGLTALRALSVGGLALGRRVIVTGASGGVGRFAVQLAALAGAHVTAVVGSASRGAGLGELGADEIVVGLAADGAPADLILESVGGPSLAAALARVAPGGAVVSYGNSAQEPTTFNVSGFYPRHGARLHGFILWGEIEQHGAARDLQTLGGLLAGGALDPQVSLRGSWRDPAPALDALLGRRLDGKAVLAVDG
jgi:NADPH:quinone reductase-like Zn-dependent oxidoreductase